MKVAIGSDHAGYRLKTALVRKLSDLGHEPVDLGTGSEDPVDYPPICAAVGRAVVSGDADRGIVLGGSGQGEAIAANKVRGVRAALCVDAETARGARKWNDANVLALSLRLLSEPVAGEIVDAWLDTAYGGTEDASLAAITARERTT